MNNELAYHCSIYLRQEAEETMKDIADRLERILKDSGLDYQYYDMELHDEYGNTLEEEK